MKNFTNNFKQFTSRLSARWLIIALMLLLGTSSAWAKIFYSGDIIYVDATACSWYEGNGCNASIYFWGTNTTGPTHMTRIAERIYSYTFTSQMNVSNFKVFRQPTSSSGWDNQYNGFEGNFDSMGSHNTIKVNSSSNGFSLSTYTPPCNVTVSVSKLPDNSIYLTGETVTLTATTTNETSFAWKEGSTQVSTNKTYPYTSNTVGTVTLKAVASSASCSDEEDVTLSFVNQKAIKIKCKYTGNGTITLYTYTWGGSNGDDTWPGTTTEKTEDGYYVWIINTETPINAIFNNGNNAQTNDIENLKVGYEYTYEWTGANKSGLTGGDNPTPLPKPCTKPNPPSIASSHSSICSGDDTEVTITVTGEAETFKLYTVTNNGNLLKETKNTKTFTVEPTQTTTYVVKAFNGDCASDNYSNDITVEVNTKPNITLTEESTAICKGEQLDLSKFASSTVDLTWWNGETQITAPVSPEQNTTYTVKAVNGACTVTKDFQVTVNALPSTPTFDPAPSYCAGDEITLPIEDKAKNTVTWYKQDGTAAGTPANTAGTYTYKAKATNANGCVSADYGTYQYTVKAKVGLAWNTISTSMLINNTQNVSTTLTGTGSVVYTSNDNTIIKVEDNKLTALKTGTATITATATGTNDYCGTATVTKEITVTCVNVNEPNISAPSSICEGNTVTLTLIDRQEGVTYTVNRETAFNAGNEYTSNQTEFTIVASHLNQCSSATTTKTVNVDPISAISLKGAPTICNGDQITLEEYVDSNTGTVTWYTNPERTQVAEDKVSPSETTTYYAKAVSGECSAATAELLVTVKQIPTSSDFTYSIPDESVVYDGNAHSIEVTWNNAGGSTGITVLYNGSETAPTTPGTYAVSVTTAEKENYCATISAVELGEFTIVCPKPNAPQILFSQNTITCNGTTEQQGKIKIDYNSNYTYEINNNVVDNIVDGFIDIETYGEELSICAINECGTSSAATTFTINSIENAPVITGNNSIQLGASTILSSDKAGTEWAVSEGGSLTDNGDGTVKFTAAEVGRYTIIATYNGCETTFEISVQDDLYVWVRRPIKKETAYDKFYAKTTTKGGALYYKEFASKPANATDCNQGGRVADTSCEDKDGYTWDGFVISKNAIENNYYFTVHAANESSKSSNDTHTYLTQFSSPDADLYFVMDETGTDNINGWNINTPVVVRASGDAMFNGNNFADFVPLYVKDANICGKEVVNFEWQKSDSQNGTYTTYNGKSGKGINNIRTREAGWYRCVVTYGDGKGTATSNSIQVTNTGGTSYTFTSKLPIIMVNTNGVGFPKEPASGFPSVDAENLKAKVSVDVIIKKGEDILYDRKARMNYRGSSSLNFKKKSYAFVSGQDSCVFDKSRHDYVKTKKEKMLNLLGDANYKTSDKDWVLYAATPDPSMMRNRLVFDLYQQMRQGEWGVHSTYVELIVDGVYQGVYVFMDKITANEGRVNITNSDGFIVKFDKTDVADRVERDGDQKTFATTRTGTKNSSDGITSYDTKIDQRFEIEYPEKEDIEDAGGSWEAFYKKVQQRFEDFETALANKQYDKVRAIIDYDSWADWFILSEFIKNQDGFRASNIFIYNGGKIMATPLWDQELSLDNRTRIAHGSNSENGLLSTTSSVYTDAFPAPFWFTGDEASITGGLLNDPCFVALVKSKWDDYQADVLSASNCSTLVAKYHGELDDNIRLREVTKWPYTQAARGTTNSRKYMGYYNDTEGDQTHYSYNASKNAITSYASKRSTSLDANSGLGKAINNLNGETLIFNIKPNIVETYPWQQSIVTVNAPEGYEYVLDYSALPVGAEVKENGNAYTIKIPRPSDWEISGNGNAKKKTYTITATIDAEGENSCGAKIENTANATINVNDVTEDCETPIVKP